MKRYVIIGDGAAGTTAAYYLRRLDPKGSIRIISEDPNPAYYRAALTNYVIGELQEDQLFAVPPDFYQRFEVERTFDRVVGVDTKTSHVALASGTEDIPFDHLLIASGGEANLPPFDGAELGGVMTMRTLQDARTVLETLSAGKVRRAVVIGGGPLGLEWVQGLRARGVAVTYIVRGQEFMPGILDRVASDLVLSRLRASGVDLRMNEEVDHASGNGWVQTIALKNSGDTLKCQLVGVAIGIRPNVAFLQGTRISMNRGVHVDQHMKTSVDNVYAAGDVAEVLDPETGQHRSFGLWEPARLQGRVAAMTMTRRKSAYLTGAHYMATRLYDLDFAAINETVEGPNDQAVVDFPRGKGRISYRKLIVRDGRLVGALLLGYRKEGVRARAMQFKRLIENEVDVSPVMRDLLDPYFDLAAWMESLDESRKPASRLPREAPGVPAVSKLMERPSLLMRMTSVTRKPEPSGGGQPPTATLTVEGTGQKIPFGGPVRIGRELDNDLVIDDPLVSGHHAEGRIDPEGRLVVVDVGSRNGTFLNEQPLGAPAPLRDGDVILVGETHIRFRASADLDQPAPGPVGLPSRPIPRPAPPSGGGLGSVRTDSRVLELRGPTATIGRDPAVEIHLKDPAVSFLHAQITDHAGVPYLRDLGSRNGTYVNEEFLTVPRALQEADVIHVGDTDLTFSSYRPSPAADRADRRDEEEGARRGARLTVRSGPLVGLSFELTPPAMIVGRDPAADISVRDQTVSWQHLELRLRGETWAVTDLGSTNGTTLNGERLERGTEHPLAAADELGLGDVVMEFGAGG